jgi:hypothetical protein
MSDPLIPDVQGRTSLLIELELQGNDLIVWGKNQGTHTIWLQSLLVFRKFANGSETRLSFGEGFPEPLKEARMIVRNQKAKLATISSGSEEVVAAQAMAGYIEITGISVSKYESFK